MVASLQTILVLIDFNIFFCHSYLRHFGIILWKSFFFAKSKATRSFIGGLIHFSCSSIFVWKDLCTFSLYSTSFYLEHHDFTRFFIQHRSWYNSAELSSATEVIKRSHHRFLQQLQTFDCFFNNFKRGTPADIWLLCWFFDAKVFCQFEQNLSNT